MAQSPPKEFKIKSVQAKGPSISLIGTHGKPVKIDDGTYSSPNGNSFTVVTGQIVELEESKTKSTVKIKSFSMKGDQISLIGTNGVTTSLAEGIYKSPSGSSIVVQNRTISSVSITP